MGSTCEFCVIQSWLRRKKNCFKMTGNIISQKKSIKLEECAPRKKYAPSAPADALPLSTCLLALRSTKMMRLAFR